MRTWIAETIMRQIVKHFRLCVSAKTERGRYSARALYHGAMVAVCRAILRLCNKEGVYR
jgi:hypothetical protein